jgi:FkbM family methyltransferase
MLTSVLMHARRIGYHLGGGIVLGNRRFRTSGYFANRLSHSIRHERFMVEVLGRELAREGAFVDVGVNVGQTLMKVLTIDPQRQYVGFEPQIACCYFVDQFLRRNELRNACVLPIALSDCNATMTLYSRGQYDEMASLADDREVTGVLRPDTTRVATRVGDEVLAELGIGAIAAIKIDVEGAELQVLRGLGKTLRTRRPPVIFEVLPNFYDVERIMRPDAVRAANQASADGIHALLDDAGYDIFQIHDRDGSETKIASFDLDDREGYAGSNFIAHPRQAAS